GRRRAPSRQRLREPTARSRATRPRSVGTVATRGPTSPAPSGASGSAVVDDRGRCGYGHRAPRGAPGGAGAPLRRRAAGLGGDRAGTRPGDGGGSRLARAPRGPGGGGDGRGAREPAARVPRISGRA